MAVKLRLKRMGSKQKPFYRIVAADSRSPRDGRFIEEIDKRNKQMLEEGKVIKQKPENPNLLSVIDLEANGWRSFKIDTIKSVEVIE